ncbi:MAG TPA: hypothetical protein VGJ20_30420 [Xanthobacteraceae bacterium]
MRQANACESVIFSQIEAHKRFRWILLPIWQPGEGKRMRRLDRSIFSFYGKGPAEAGAAHPPFATNPKIGLNVRGLKTAFRAPPPLALLGIGQRLKNPLGRRFDGYFLNDGFVCTNCRHLSSST